MPPNTKFSGLVRRTALLKAPEFTMKSQQLLVHYHDIYTSDHIYRSTGESKMDSEILVELISSAPLRHCWNENGLKYDK